jgi:hypothetical protein
MCYSIVELVPDLKPSYMLILGHAHPHHATIGGRYDDFVVLRSLTYAAISDRLQVSGTYFVLFYGRILWNFQTSVSEVSMFSDQLLKR